MDTRAVEASLAAAGSYEDWVATLAAEFDAAGLHFGHGTDNAGDEAFWLVRQLQGWREDAWSERPDAALIPRAIAIAGRRIGERVPLAYLLGEAWFAGLQFDVTPDVLIPRSPLAEVIERGFAPWCELAAGDRILDVGTGSGCLAIAAAHHCPGTLVDATDTSAAALAVAAGNVARHGLAGRVDLINADLFPSVAKRYRVIISNPPYVSAAEWAVLPPEYAYEPAAALVGGPSGIEPATRLLEGARARLAERGVLIVEVGVAAEALMQKFPRLEAVWIELERGGEGAFAISAEELERSGF